MNTTDYSQNFSAYAWEELCEAPVLAGLTVMDAHPSGWLGTREELRTLRASFAPAEEDHPLVVEVKKSILAQDLIGPELNTPFEEIRVRTLTILQDLSSVLREQVDDQARQAYLQFVKTVMVQVANAAREGGLLSAQPGNISDQEHAVIEELSHALDPQV